MKGEVTYEEGKKKEEIWKKQKGETEQKERKRNIRKKDSTK